MLLMLAISWNILPSEQPVPCIRGCSVSFHLDPGPKEERTQSNMFSRKVSEAINYTDAVGVLAEDEAW